MEGEGEITAEQAKDETRDIENGEVPADVIAALGAGDLMALARRFEAGQRSAGDAIRVIGAGLRGAGSAIDDEAVSRMRADGGAAGFVRIVADLLGATFGGGDG